MKTIDRYIFRELTLTFLLGLLSLNFVLMTEKVLRVTKVLASVGASFSDLGWMMLLIQPQITVLTTPMAFLVAILLTYGRLNTDNEVVVLKASGVPFRRISSPVITLGIICFAACAVLGFYVAPAGTLKLKNMVAEVVVRRAPEAIEEGIFNTAFDDVVIYAKEKADGNRLSGIFIYDERDKGRPLAMYAGEGGVSSDPEAGYDITFDLRDGHIHMAREGGSTDISFGKYVMTIPISVKAPTKAHSELTPGEIIREAGRQDEKKRVRLLLEFHRRLSLPAVCLILMFLGPPLALKAGKTGRMGGLTMGLGVFAIYYAALMYAENLARVGRLPHYVAAWLPALVLGALSVYMFMREDSR